ncbi:MAG: class I poly(R)-hydroxyalkanoic acid synthase, partial [Pseudolabrys sp.]
MDKRTGGQAKRPLKETPTRPPGGPALAPAGKPVAEKPATPSPAPSPAVNIEALSRNLARLIEEGGKTLAAYMKPREQGQVKDEVNEDLVDIVRTLGQVLEYWLADPQRTTELQAGLGAAFLDLWAAAARRLTGETVPPVASADPKDKRFADPEWSQNQYFDFLKQAYLLTSQWGEHLVKNAEGVDAHTRAKAEFYVKQIANAISPSNFVLTNPELLRETMSSNAENLVRGMRILAEDIEAG